MRIALLTEYYPDRDNPGNGVYVHTRAAAYRAAGHDVRVYRTCEGGPESYEYEGVPVIAVSSRSARDDVMGFTPAVVALHTPYPGTPHVRFAESITVPRVAWVHGYEAMIPALHGYHRGLNRWLSIPYDLRKLWRIRRALASAAAVVYVSEWMRRTAQKSMRLRHPRTRVIANPVDTERFRPHGDRDISGRMRGLALRGLRAKYGLDLAVAAFSGLRDTELTIIGTGPDAARLRRQIDDENASVTLEERSVAHANVPQLMSRYDYFVAPARTEAQGVAMCEAMACGLPIVATRAGGIPEFVRDGEDGYLVRTEDPQAIRDAVMKLIRDPERAKAMGREARENVEAKCAARRVIRQELETLMEAVR